MGNFKKKWRWRVGHGYGTVGWANWIGVITLTRRYGDSREHWHGIGGMGLGPTAEDWWMGVAATGDV